MKTNLDIEKSKEDLAERMNGLRESVQADEDPSEIKSDAQFVMLCVSIICSAHFRKAFETLKRQIAFVESHDNSDSDELVIIRELAEYASASDALCDLCNELDAFSCACIGEDGTVSYCAVSKQMMPYVSDNKE